MVKKEHEKKREIPDFFKGKILLELLQKPILTPDGITYDQSVLETHIQKNGSFDPITRKKISKYQLFENKHISGLIRGYLDENPWAFDYEDIDLPENN